MEFAVAPILGLILGVLYWCALQMISLRGVFFMGGKSIKFCALYSLCLYWVTMYASKQSARPARAAGLLCDVSKFNHAKRQLLFWIIARLRGHLMRLVYLIQALARLRFSWIMLLLLGIVLEACGLYFQYELRLPPCVNCVYERAFYLSFILAGLIGFIRPSNFLFRNLANLTFLSGSIGGVFVAFDHITSVYQTGLGASCKLRASFPDFLKLDEWLPWMFSPTASCEPLNWSLLGLSMPEWILISFVCGVAVSSCFLISEFFKRKRKSYDFYR